jgi:hypothetical protein
MPEFDDESGGSDSDADSGRPGPPHRPEHGGRPAQAVALPAVWAAAGPKRKAAAGRAGEVTLPRIKGGGPEPERIKGGGPEPERIKGGGPEPEHRGGGGAGDEPGALRRSRWRHVRTRAHARTAHHHPAPTRPPTSARHTIINTTHQHQHQHLHQHSNCANTSTHQQTKTPHRRHRRRARRSVFAVRSAALAARSADAHAAAMRLRAGSR